MSKRPPGRPMGMKCTKRNGVSLSIKDKITLDKKHIHDMVVYENSDNNRDKTQQNFSGKEKIPIYRMVSHTKELICDTEQRSFMLEEQITSIYLTI
jgi:hypothetical protein